MNILVFGAGAIGCHIAYCMHEAGHDVSLICRGEHYDQIKKDGMRIHIYDNERLKHEKTIEESFQFKIMNNLNDIKQTRFDYIFITVKLDSYNEETLARLHPFMGKDTAVIPPCTKIPFWWLYNLSEKYNTTYNNVDFDPLISKYFNRRNIIMMTMWLSAVIDRPGHVMVRHIQRGYPLGALYPDMNSRAEKLRSIFNATCLSPEVKDIRSEIFIKSINSLAFNAVALDKEFNNLQLRQDKDSRESIKKIMMEGDEILSALNFPVIQNADDRIRQTLSSTKHVMSMLYAYQSGRTVELDYVWDGFDRISKMLGVRMDFTRQLCERVLAKINSFESA